MKHKALILIGWGILALTAVPGVFSGEEDRTLLLNIGPASFKDKTLDIAPNVIFSARTGQPVTFEQMVRELAACRFVYIGESHNNLAMHDIQASVIRALYDKDRDVALGLEMYPVTDQEPLTKWGLGLLTEPEFLVEGQWYVQWNFNFGYYRKIFLLAKEHRIPIYGLNIPRTIITKLRMGGRDLLPPGEQALVPSLDLSNPDHRRLIRTVFESSDIPPQMKGAGLDMVFEGLYRSQVAWDEAMAANARKAAEAEKKRFVILAGSGHLLYNLGINLRVFDKNHLPGKTIVCVSVPADARSLKVSRNLADFIWGIPEEKRPAYPDIGLAFKKFPGLDNLVLERKPIDGAASAADFDKGDVVLDVDGKPYSDINTLRTYLAGFNWDQEVKFRILRGGQVKDVTLRLVQPPPKETSK